MNQLDHNSLPANQDFDALNSLLDKVQISLLENKVNELKKICDEIDPYTELPLSMKERLIEVGITDFSDPFKITNQIIKTLEDSMEELDKLSPFMNQDK